MVEIEVRAMGTGDVPDVRSLIERTVRASYRDAYSERAIEFFIHYHGENAIMKDLRHSTCLVALVRGEIVGTATLRGESIIRVFVEPEWQGTGIGRELIGSLLDQARASGSELVKLDASLVSRTFYERLGFLVVADRSHDLGNGHVLPYLKMMLRL
jgi:predicted N-acetyltransferase YhbS